MTGTVGCATYVGAQKPLQEAKNFCQQYILSVLSVCWLRFVFSDRGSDILVLRVISGAENIDRWFRISYYFVDRRTVYSILMSTTLNTGASLTKNVTKIALSTKNKYEKHFHYCFDFFTRLPGVTRTDIFHKIFLRGR